MIELARDKDIGHIDISMDGDYDIVPKWKPEMTNEDIGYQNGAKSSGSDKMNTIAVNKDDTILIRPRG